MFDNAVDRLTEILRGKPGIELYRLTSDRRLSSATRAIANARNIDLALKGTAAQGCFVFMTSHATTESLYLDAAPLASRPQLKALIAVR